MLSSFGNLEQPWPRDRRATVGQSPTTCRTLHSSAALRIVVIDHAGHFWPHPRGEWFDWAIARWGFRNQDFDAADLVWGFFSSGDVK